MTLFRKQAELFLCNCAHLLVSAMRSIYCAFTIFAVIEQIVSCVILKCQFNGVWIELSRAIGK